MCRLSWLLKFWVDPMMSVTPFRAAACVSSKSCLCGESNTSSAELVVLGLLALLGLGLRSSSWKWKLSSTETGLGWSTTSAGPNSENGYLFFFTETPRGVKTSEIPPLSSSSASVVRRSNLDSSAALGWIDSIINSMLLVSSLSKLSSAAAVASTTGATSSLRKSTFSFVEVFSAGLVVSMSKGHDVVLEFTAGLLCLPVDRFELRIGFSEIGSLLPWALVLLTAAAAFVAVSFSVIREMSLLLSELRRLYVRSVSGPVLVLPFKNSCLVDCTLNVLSVTLLSSLSFTMKGFDQAAFFPFSNNWGHCPVPVMHLMPGEEEPGLKGLASFTGNDDNPCFPWGSGDKRGDLALVSRAPCVPSWDPLAERAVIRSFLVILGVVAASISELPEPWGSWRDVPEEVCTWWTCEDLRFAAASSFSPPLHATLHIKVQIASVQLVITADSFLVTFSHNASETYCKCNNQQMESDL